jgi:hypothetical protein
MADKNTDTTPTGNTDAANEMSKAAQERLDYFYKNHRPPAGYRSRVVNNEIVIEPIVKKKG